MSRKEQNAKQRERLRQIRAEADHEGAARALRNERFLKLAAEGLPAWIIAERLGLSAMQVRHLAARMAVRLAREDA